MTGRTKYTAVRIETEIEKNREEANWAKVIDLATSLKDKSPDCEFLADFLVGEGRLESYLEEWPPIESNIHKAKLGLMDARKYLNAAANDMGKKAGVALDAYLLLGKLYYACGNYNEGLKSFKLAELHTLSEKKLPLRSLKIVAESYAIKGLCLQKDSSGVTSKYKKAEKEEEMYKCFELASDLTLLYMQELDKQQSATFTNTGTHSPQPPAVNKNLSPVLEQALQQAPVMLIQQNKFVETLDRYRASLSAVECQTTNVVRLKLMCQFAEFLLQGSVAENYKSPLNSPPHPNSFWKPKHYNGINQFIPKVDCEETILVLLVAEAMAVRNAVLSQSPEFKEARLSAYQDAASVYDLLTLATVRWGQVSLLQESLERAMKFSFEEPHLWRQHALSLISMGRYEHALVVLKEVIKLEQNSSVNCLLAAKICYEHLNRPFDGTEFSLQAKTKELAYSSGLLGRCHLYVGIGYHLQARAAMLKQPKEEYNEKALTNFQTSVELEPNDHLCKYYLGLQLALTGHIPEALATVSEALALQPENSSTLHLLTLLLSANRKHEEALEVVEAAIEEYPDSLNLMYVRAHLELHEEGGERALVTAKQMLELWKNLYEGQTSSDIPECDRKSDTRSVFQLYTSEMSDKDSSSLQAHSIAASRVEQALSEVASSVSSFSPRPGPQRSYMLLLEVWLLLAELYLAVDQPADVLKCIQEASQIFPLSHHILHMRGLLHMHKQEWTDAKLFFQNAVAINPQHVKSLQQLGLVYHYLGLQGLAETTLREAAKIDPSNHITWYNLGKVLESLGEFETASSSMATALTVETTSPILPFSSVPLCFD
ncbi:PREDICTED: tetratricopeptide repeat protein 7B [Nicrophorus vespilloides]|uniref:Tetratricopeptide repeat protein 7B n=1 Tax=Nicrophorus vespilloides TaxID=110193 RepID=A0ABM1M835_NICVS|nr:PREDICTED: tetratricopeptide repeat protein 7B [Nicrophorus vespilloides]